MIKVDPARLEAALTELLAENNHVLAVMKAVESSEIPPGKTALEVLAEEMERQGLIKGASDETKK